MSILVKREAWYISIKKGKDKLLPEYFQKSPILVDIDQYDTPIEFSKFIPTIQTPIQFIRFLETLLHFKVCEDLTVLPAIEYIKAISFDDTLNIIKCPIEMMFTIIHENIRQIQNSIELFKLINYLSEVWYTNIVQMGLKNKYRDIHTFKNVLTHLLYLCAKYDFKEYFIFMLGESAKNETIFNEEKARLNPDGARLQFNNAVSALNRANTQLVIAKLNVEGATLNVKDKILTIEEAMSNVEVATLNRNDARSKIDAINIKINKLYDAKPNKHLLLSILILNNSKKIFYYLLSNAIDDVLMKELSQDKKILHELMRETPNDDALIPFYLMEEISTKFYHKEIDMDFIKQIKSIFSTKYEEYISTLFNITCLDEHDDYDSDDEFSIRDIYYTHNRDWFDITHYVQNNDDLIILDENMVIKLLQIYKYMIKFNIIVHDKDCSYGTYCDCSCPYGQSDGIEPIYNTKSSKHTCISALNMSIRHNYYDIFIYLSRKCSDIILPVYLTDSVTIDVSTIIKQDNIEFIERLSTSKFVREHGFKNTNLFNDHIKRAITSGKLNNTIVSIEMMDFIYSYFGEKYSVSHLLFNMCGNLDTVMNYLYNYETFITPNHILKIIEYNCTLDDITTLITSHKCCHDERRGTIFDQVKGNLLLFSIVFQREDIYDYIIFSILENRRLFGQYHDKISIFNDIEFKLCKNIDIDYFISKLQHLIQNKIIDVTNHYFIIVLIKLCILNIRFIRVVNAVYDWIIEYKLYIKPYIVCHCSEYCYRCINTSEMSEYLISDVMRIEKITPYLEDRLNDFCPERGLKCIATICKVFGNNYKKFFPIYEKCNYSEIRRRFIKIEIIGKDFIEKYLYYMRLIYKELLDKKIKKRYIPECILEFIKFDINDYIETVVEYDDPNCTRHDESYRRYGVWH